MDLFDVIYSVRAQRKFLSEPVPDSMISQLLDAAIRAPSAGNRQEWLFVIMQDSEQRRKIAAIYERASVAIMGFYRQRGKPAHLTEVQYTRLLESGKHLHHNMDQAPVLLLACMRTTPVVIPPEAKALDESAIVKQIERTRAASIYPAVQNLILACRALRLGTVPTTNHLLYEDEVKAVLGLPQEVATYVLMPIGYPEEKFGPVRRRPISEVAIRDRWGTPWRTNQNETDDNDKPGL